MNRDKPFIDSDGNAVILIRNDAGDVIGSITGDPAELMDDDA